MNRKIEPYIETYTGIRFWFLNPKPEMVCIEDIAHALGMQCRFTGHTERFYSVAEHCYHVSHLAKDPLQGLLHDASEAYLTDIASPIKPQLTNYKKLELGIMVPIAEKFGFSWPMSADTVDADTVQLKTEARHLMNNPDWIKDFPTRRRYGRKPECWTPELAKQAFLERFYELTASTRLRAA